MDIVVTYRSPSSPQAHQSIMSWRGTHQRSGVDPVSSWWVPLAEKQFLEHRNCNDGNHGDRAKDAESGLYWLKHSEAPPPLPPFARHSFLLGFTSSPHCASKPQAQLQSCEHQHRRSHRHCSTGSQTKSYQQKGQKKECRTSEGTKGKIYERQTENRGSLEVIKQEVRASFEWAIFIWCLRLRPPLGIWN